MSKTKIGTRLDFWYAGRPRGRHELPSDRFLFRLIASSYDLLLTVDEVIRRLEHLRSMTGVR